MFESKCIVDGIQMNDEFETVVETAERLLLEFD